MACMRDGFAEGRLLGDRFLTVSPLNHGSFGMVFSAKDTLTGADVALKCIIKPGGVQDITSCPAAIATDDRSEELPIHSRLPTHDNIVNLVHHFETEAHQYMALELCSNGDLYEAIRGGRGPLETEHVRDFMLELVDAVDHIHAHGVFHRDIKPENIFLSSSGAMKLGDFGLATTETWSTEFAVGSDRYMAPEQYDSSVYGYGYSPASADVWAVGIVLLNVLFQRNPFATPTIKDPLFDDFVRDRQSLFDVFPNMSQDTFNVLVHCLALDPANRSLGAVREALKAAVSFTTDDESLDDFCCTEQNEPAPMATAAREPLRTPSVSVANVDDNSFPWTSALHKTPPKNTRQLSTIADSEPELYPGSVKSEWQYVDADEASLSSNLDSGLGMSYKSSGKSVNSRSLKQPSFVGSLPISFSRPTTKVSPYGNGFSKSWSDLWDEEEEMEQARTSFEAGMDIERTDTVKPSTPQLRTIEEDERGSSTPRPILLEDDDTSRAASPLRRLVEHDRANPESPKQRSSSILDKWAALGNFRRAKEAPPVASAPSQPKTKYSDAFASFTPFTNKKQKSQSKLRDTAIAWRQESPTRLRSSSSVNNSKVWERKEKEVKEPKDTAKEHSPVNIANSPWVLDRNWREHKARPATTSNAKESSSYSLSGQHLQFGHVSPLSTTADDRKLQKKSFLEDEFSDDIGDLEWVGGWHDFN